ncbi:hypothetical protein FRC18_004552 [Serendipita sp. 400]|nr:hypothetical protein FRC18_004552 [Serendipita sp. 400]
MTVRSSLGGQDVSDTENMIQIWNTDVWSTDAVRGAVPSDLHLDQNGWVNQANGDLLFWVPEDCRNGLTCPAILTIPTGGFGDVVRLDLNDACFGGSWEQIKANG